HLATDAHRARRCPVRAREPEAGGRDRDLLDGSRVVVIGRVAHRRDGRLGRVDEAGRGIDELGDRHLVLADVDAANLLHPEIIEAVVWRVAGGQRIAEPGHGHIVHGPQRALHAGFGKGSGARAHHVVVGDVGLALSQERERHHERREDYQTNQRRRHGNTALVHGFHMFLSLTWSWTFICWFRALAAQGLAACGCVVSVIATLATLAGVAVTTPFESRYVSDMFETPPIRTSRTPLAVRWRLVAVRVSRVGRGEVRAAAATAVTEVAERSSRIMRSSATRAFCWASTLAEPTM